MNIDERLAEAVLAVDELFSDPAAAAADYRRFLQLLVEDEQEEPEQQGEPELATPAGSRSPAATVNRDGRPAFRGSQQAGGEQSAQRAAISTMEQPNRAPGRTTGAAREKLAADLRRKYNAGASIRALAEETGRSMGFVHRLLSETGVTLRGRGGATRGRKASDR